MTAATTTPPRKTAPPPAGTVAVITPNLEIDSTSGWRRLIQEIDATKRGAYALNGPPLRPGVAYEMPTGAIVVAVDRTPAGWHIRMLRADLPCLETIHAWQTKTPLGKRVVDYIARRLPTEAAGHQPHRLEATPNRFPGRCALCRGAVPAGTGIVTPASRHVTHQPGTCPPPPQIITPNRWAGTCGACGGWVPAGQGVAIRLTTPRPTGAQYEPMHTTPCPADAPPGPPNQRPGWCADCGEPVASGSGYWLMRRLQHHGPCPEPTVGGPAWIWRAPAGTRPVAGEAAWVRLTLRPDDPPADQAPGYRVLDDGYVELVAVPVEVAPGRPGRTRARVRAATPAEAADLLAERLSTAEIARPHTTGHRARFTAEKIGDARPWLAEITGHDAAYGYRRKFLPPDRDYTDANSKGTRGIVYGWTLGLNRAYEARYPLSWTKATQVFLRATPEGDVAKITREEVEAWLNHTAAWVAS